MLAQRAKIKRSSQGSWKKCGLFKQNIGGQTEPFDDSFEDENEKFVDEKYRDFHRNRQSEKVLNVIRSVLKTSNLSLQDKQSSQKYVGGLASDEPPNIEEQRETQEEFKGSAMTRLREENQSLKSNLCLVFDYLNATTSNENTTVSEPKNDDSLCDAKSKHKANKNGKSNYEKSGKNEQNNVLTSLVVDLKIQCLQEKTEKELLRLKIDELQECFDKAEENYRILLDQFELFQSSFATRLEKVSDNVHKLKYPKNRNIIKRIFSRKIRVH